MTPHDLNTELQGYRHARLQQPSASTNPHYLRGYRQGTHDRLQFGPALEQHFQH